MIMTIEDKATLVLEDGTSFDGISIGVPGERMGKIILNTAVVGYQEMMSDPANAGKILILTYPLIGNYGVAEKFYESRKCWIGALVIKEDSRIYSNWQAEDSFSNFLRKEDMVAIGGLDTRTLAVTIRDNGEMLGMVSTKPADKSELLKKLKDYKKDKRDDFIKDISVKNIMKINNGASGPKIGILDLGIVTSFIKQLKILGCDLTLLPYSTPAPNILSLRFDGLIISSGPEDDAALPEVVKTVKEILGKVPILGISTGHEIIGLALGGKLRSMKIGHHGVNYPIKGPDSYRGEITVQNHSFVIDEESLKGKVGVKVTMHNINDNSIEELESKNMRFISVQYYPTTPGFDEVNNVFRRFLAITKRAKGPTKRKGASTTYKEVQHAKA